MKTHLREGGEMPTLNATGQFRVKNPDSYKLVKKIEKSLKSFRAEVRGWTHPNGGYDKAGYDFKIQYQQLAKQVKESGFMMEQAFPSLQAAYRATMDSPRMGEVTKALDNVLADTLFSLATYPVPKEMLKQTEGKLDESIWATRPVELGENFQMLSGLKPRFRITEEKVGEIILKQMGGAGRLRSMIGASFGEMTDGVAIRWPSKQRSKGNHVEITLRPDDTYNLEFSNVSAQGKRPVKKYEGIYSDMLVDTFEKQTGYFLRL